MDNEVKALHVHYVEMDHSFDVLLLDGDNSPVLEMPNVPLNNSFRVFNHEFHFKVLNNGKFALKDVANNDPKSEKIYANFEWENAIVVDFK